LSREGAAALTCGGSSFRFEGNEGKDPAGTRPLTQKEKKIRGKKVDFPLPGEKKEETLSGGGGGESSNLSGGEKGY